MEVEGTGGSKRKGQRAIKKSDVAATLRKMAENATELAQHAERASQALRQEAFRNKKHRDRLRIVLQMYTGVLDILKRVNVEPLDREFLESSGYLRAKKERSE